MRILIYGINFAPELTGTGKYSGEMAAWLAARGHEVRVISAPPYYPEWRVTDDYRWFWYRREVWMPGEGASVEVRRCPIWVPSNPNGMKRLLHLSSYALSSAVVALGQARWRPQVVVAVAPTLATAPSAVLAARLSGAKSWLHVQDFEVDVAFDIGLLASRALKKLVTGIETSVLRRFDRVSTISARCWTV
jgi:colanic acid biosynthesis glycosyl transferase WcaI